RATGPVPASVFRTVALLLFATGFVALGEEVLWTRFLAPIVGGTVRTYTLTLTLVLVGIVLGSALATRLADRARARVFVLGLLQVASALLVWFLLFLPPAWWRSLGGELPTAALLLLPPAVLPGASFPLAVRMVVTTPAWAGLGLGTMLAINTLGGIAGALVIGFFVLPGFGLEAGARLCTGLSLAAGILAWIGLERSAGPAPRPAPRPVPRLILAAAAIAVWLAIPGLTGTRVPADFLADRSLLVAMREGVESNVAVVRRSAGGIALEIDRWWQGQDRKTHQVIAAHLPMLVHPRPRTVLLVGVGAGQTPERFAMYDIERLDCADIEPRVFDVVRAHFPSAWMNDRRVTLLPVDGRNHLVHTDARYDVISLEVGQLFRPGAAGFYTLDFYRRARARLAPGGILSQFVPLPFLSADELRGVVATFLDAFPGATLWYNTSELLLIGPESGSVRLGRERITEVLADSAIARDLEFSPWGGSDAWFSRPEVEAGAFLCGPQGLAALSRGGTIYRDDPSRLEYEVARPKEDDRREIATLPLVRAHLDPIESVAPWIPPDLASAAAAVREENLREVIAAAYLRSVDPARDRNDLVRVEALVRQALAAQPRNAMANRILGDALLLQGRTGDAEKAYRQALAISEGDARAHAGLALLALTTGRLPEATSHYRVALALEENADWRNNLGSALAQTGDVAGALAEFERAVELRPDFVDARRNADQARAVLASGYQNPARGRTESDSI
ncbi:MAG: fused MFS/spermidine synthase, partial [Candidatus Eiseniibacteriota bacterium]